MYDELVDGLAVIVTKKKNKKKELISQSRVERPFLLYSLHLKI